MFIRVDRFGSEVCSQTVMAWSMDRAKKCAEICTVGGLIAIVWLLFTISTVVQFSLKEEPSSGHTSSDAETCVQEVYEGVCKQHLLVYQDCNYNTTAANKSLEGGVVYIPSGKGNQEDTAHEALAAATEILMPTTECKDDLLSYLCLSLFGVCTDGGEVVRPSSGQCERLRTEVCASEWERAEADPTTLPPVLADQLLFIRCASLANYSVCDSTTNTTNNSTDRECSSDFYLNEFGNCLPLCGEWQQYSDSTAVAMEIIVLLFASTALMLSLVVIVLSCIQYKRMLRLPGVLIVYQLISLSVLQAVRIISYTDIKSLYCSHTDVVATLSDPTPFCYFIGAVAIYGFLHTMLIWLCHTITMLCAIKFPFRVRRLLDNPKHSRYLHVAILLACSFLPAIPVGCSFVNGDYITVFPPAYCVAEGHRTMYYILIIPMSIVGAGGNSCLVLILWSLVRHRKAKQCEADRHTALWVTHMKAELKVLVVLLCHTLVMVSAIANYSVVLLSNVDLEQELTDYFNCESLGGNCSRSGFEDADLTPYFITANEIALIVYLLVTMIYAVNLTEIKEGLRKVRKEPKNNTFKGLCESTLSKKSEIMLKPQ